MLHAGSLYRRTRVLEGLLRLWTRRPHEPDFAAFSLLGRRDGIFLDVGANAGLAAVSFRIFQPDMPIVSLEPNRAHETDLRFMARFLGDFRYIIAGASDVDGELTLYVPTYRSVSLTPLASMRRDLLTSVHRQTVLFGQSLDDADFSVHEQRVPVHRIDALDLVPAYVKLDVEGHEAHVLRGMERTLARHRPVLLVEWSPEFDPIRAYLTERNYELFVFARGATRFKRFDGTNRHINIFCLPSEGVGAVAAVSRIA